MVIVIPLVPKTLGGSPEQWEARLLDYAAGERLQGTIADVVDDTTPQLGGSLDLNSNKVVSGAQDIMEWTGSILNILGNPLFVANVGTPADGYVIRYNSSTVQWEDDLLGAVDVTFNDSVSVIGQTTVQGALDYIVASAVGGGIGSVFADKSPQLGGTLQLGHPTESTRNFQDHLGGEILSWSATPSAVNYITVANGATTDPPVISSTGTDADIDLSLTPKGTGRVLISSHISLSKTGTTLYDRSSNEILVLDETSSAVNHIQITNQIAGTRPSIAAVGDDTNLGISIFSKGSGPLYFQSAGGTLDSFSVVPSATPANHVRVQSADAGANPIVRATGETNIDLILAAAGTGVVKVGADEIASLAATQTLTNKTLTSCLVDVSILDTNSKVWINQTSIASAVNYLEISNSALGSDPVITVGGIDSSLDLRLEAKGSGKVRIANSALSLQDSLIYGTFGNKILSVTDTASASDWVEINNSTSSNSPGLTGTGLSTDVDLLLDAKGAGRVQSVSSLIDAQEAPFIAAYECEAVGVVGGAVGSAEATAALSTITQVSGWTGVFQYVLDTVNDDLTVPLSGYYEIMGFLSTDKSDSGVSWIELKIQTDQSGSFADEANSDMRSAVAGSKHGFVSTRTRMNLNDAKQVRLRHNSPDSTQTVRQLRLSIRRISDQV